MKIAGHRPASVRGVSKKLGDAVTLRAMWWEGPHRPLPGDTLKTATGRRYLIREVHDGRGRTVFVLLTTVVPDELVVPSTSREFQWSWKQIFRR